MQKRKKLLNSKASSPKAAAKKGKEPEMVCKACQGTLTKFITPKCMMCRITIGLLLLAAVAFFMTGSSSLWGSHIVGAHVTLDDMVVGQSLPKGFIISMIMVIAVAIAYLALLFSGNLEQR